MLLRFTVIHLLSFFFLAFIPLIKNSGIRRTSQKRREGGKKKERINYSTVEIRTEAREYTGSLIIASFIFLYIRRVGANLKRREEGQNSVWD